MPIVNPLFGPRSVSVSAEMKLHFDQGGLIDHQVLYPNSSTKVSAEVWLDANNQRHRDGGPAVVREDGAKEWYQHGKLHRLNAPAVEGGSSAVYGDQFIVRPFENHREYWHQGERHREDGPAQIMGIDYTYYRHGKLHRVGGPAVKYLWATEYWQDGLLHREDGPAKQGPDNSKEWFVRGKRHNLEGPAVIQKGLVEWHQNGLLHREAGPARTTYNRGEKLQEIWYYQGEYHRDDGPAYNDLITGQALWYCHGKLTDKNY